MYFDFSPYGEKVVEQKLLILELLKLKLMASLLLESTIDEGL